MILKKVSKWSDNERKAYKFHQTDVKEFVEDLFLRIPQLQTVSENTVLDSRKKEFRTTVDYVGATEKTVIVTSFKESNLKYSIGTEFYYIDKNTAEKTVTFYTL